MANATQATPTLTEVPRDLPEALRELLEEVRLTLDIRENRAAKDTGRNFITAAQLDALIERVVELEARDGTINGG